MKTLSHRCDPRRTNIAKPRLQQRAGAVKVGPEVRDSVQKACLKSPNHQGFRSRKSVGLAKQAVFYQKKINKKEMKHLSMDKFQTRVECTINKANIHNSTQSRLLPFVLGRN